MARSITIDEELYEAIQQIKMAIKEASNEDFSDEQVVELLVESFYDASFEDMEGEEGEMDDDVAAAHAHHNHDHHDHKHGKDCNCGDDCDCKKGDKKSHKTDTKVTTKTDFETDSDI